MPTPTELDASTLPATFDGIALPIPPAAPPSHPSPDPEATSAATHGLHIRLARRFGIDRAVAFSVLARAWQSLAGLGTITLIARFLSPVEQGFYYTFYSLVAIQFVFELGFSVVILQTASHEAAHLRIATDGSITGPEIHHSRLASVLQKSIRWYTVAALLMGATLIPLGVFFFRHAAAKPGAGGVHFVLPWLLVVVASCLTFQVDPIFSFLEGCGYVPEVARTRLRQSLLSSALGWSALLLHKGLYAPGLFILGQAIAGGWFVAGRRKLLLPLLRHATAKFRIDWGVEVWPFQWRMAVSWLAGYLGTQLFVPALMDFHGPIAAGQMGMSNTVSLTLTMMAIAWMNTKQAPMGRLIALKQYDPLDRLFLRTLIQSVGAALAAFLTVWLIVYYLSSHNTTLFHTHPASRLLPPVPLAFLFGGAILNVIVMAEAYYLRAHKQEKFMIPSIMGACFGSMVAFFVGRNHGPHGGAWGIAAAYFLGTAVIGVGFGTYIFLKWRRIWHAA